MRPKFIFPIIVIVNYWLLLSVVSFIYSLCSFKFISIAFNFQPTISSAKVQYNRPCKFSRPWYHVKSWTSSCLKEIWIYHPSSSITKSLTQSKRLPESWNYILMNQAVTAYHMDEFVNARGFLLQAVGCKTASRSNCGNACCSSAAVLNLFVDCKHCKKYQI